MADNDNQNGGEELIEVVGENVAAGSLWRPEVGEETEMLLEHLLLDNNSKPTIRHEAHLILSRCLPVDQPEGQRTGLVVGYVQSGKTASFTTITALARDNGYHMIIVIAGTSNILAEQTRDRLRRDLQIGRRQDWQWDHIHEPSRDECARIADTLEEWNSDDIPPEEKRTLLITVKKHHVKLRNLIDVLSRTNLTGHPILVVDDEGDQAGLNNLARSGTGRESTTYRRIRELRQILPQHTFLQYTATPQGPLLINIIDVLSPEFCVVLTPGDNYTGGYHFFINNPHLIRNIPSREVPTGSNPLHEPPRSLLQALRIFFIAVCSGLIRREHYRHKRSMMVHPSKRVLVHSQYHHWVVQIRRVWLDLLRRTEGNPDDPDRVDLIVSFREAYDDLHSTVPNLETFDTLVRHLPRAIHLARLHLINSEADTTTVDWASAYPHILVGGQALDRGFTVEGLTITYMPRGIGVGNADTIQQRARFFGYGRAYSEYCRVFLENALADAYRRYVTHEVDLRSRLSRYSETGQPLSELRRVFLMDSSLRPTRNSILDIDYVRLRFTRQRWVDIKSPHEDVRAVENNRRTVQEFLRSLDLEENQGHADRQDHQRHNIATSLRLEDVYESLLVKLRFANLSDSQNYTGLLLVLKNWYLTHQEQTCTVYEISKGLIRQRGVDKHGKIKELFQGAYPDNQGRVYPGDRRIRGEDNVTVQIHRLRLTEGNDNTAVIMDDVPTVAVWISPAVGIDVIDQPQGRRLS